MKSVATTCMYFASLRARGGQRILRSTPSLLCREQAKGTLGTFCTECPLFSNTVTCVIKRHVILFTCICYVCLYNIIIHAHLSRNCSTKSSNWLVREQRSFCSCRPYKTNFLIIISAPSVHHRACVLICKITKIHVHVALQLYCVIIQIRNTCEIGQ